MFFLDYLKTLLFQLIGSSLLLIHDGDNASIWMIDFEKSTPMPPDVPILHTVPWVSKSP